MSVWSGVLDSCPGLLCCVVNTRGTLLYATHGYKSVAARLFGHKCDEGRSYPPRISQLDKIIHDCLTAACVGGTNAIEISEGVNLWELSASPLVIEGKEIAGVVMRLTQKESAKSLPPVIKSDPEILNSVPFLACVVNFLGEILAANKFLASCSKSDLNGKNIADILEDESKSEIMNIIAKRSGNIECLTKEILAGENFYDFAEKFYLDENFNELEDSSEPEYRRVKIYASPIEWSAEQAILLTFEDITELKRNREQLRRLLTYDETTGILNKRGLEHAARREISAAIKNSEPLSVIMFSVDSFRESENYEAGNRALRELVRVMRRSLAGRGNFFPGHWDTEIFAVVCPCSGAAAVVLAEEIRGKVKGITVSAGVSDFQDGGYFSADEILGAAYDAMNEAKKNNSVILAKKS